MNNYRLYAKLFHKPDSSNLSAVPCEVEKWIPINHWTFEQIKRSPLLDLEVVKAYHSNMFYDNGINHCIMLLDDCGNGGILVEARAMTIRGTPASCRTLGRYMRITL